MINSGQKGLFSILNQAGEKNNYENALSKAFHDYQLKPYNILKLHPLKIAQIYRQIQSKFYNSSDLAGTGIWFENQLRIFVWVVVIYGFLQGKKIEQMSETDWVFFSTIFNNKNPMALEFQSLCLIRKQKSRKWAQQQINLLTSIIQSKPQKNRWNQIAKAIFIESNKKFFRTPKQCREQWINHLDPTKTRTEWTNIEDYQLIKGIQKNGKKWSKVAKQIGNKRTEHMVKNRFKSLLNTEIKRMPEDANQTLLVSKIKQRLQTSAAVKKYLNFKKSKKEIESLQNIQGLEVKQQQMQNCLIAQQINSNKLNKNINQSTEISKKILQTESPTKGSKLAQKSVEKNSCQKMSPQKWNLQNQIDLDELDIRQFIFSLESQNQPLRIDDFFV